MKRINGCEFYTEYIHKEGGLDEATFPVVLHEAKMQSGNTVFAVMFDRHHLTTLTYNPTRGLQPLSLRYCRSE
jgi:hypothetical protein